MSSDEGLAVRASALPAISPEQMVAALKKYKELQTALDSAMPDQIMDLDGKKFRKKGYWRAIALAFNLQVEMTSERREISGRFQDNRDNFGWIVSYVAKHPTGREMTGDGSCFAVEKARRFKCPHPEREGSRRTLHFPHNTCPDFDPDFQWRVLPSDATEHNVRSHAHTRAFNRAVSNLVGFGEVSAEEVERDEHGGSSAGDQSSSSTTQQAGAGRTDAAAAAAQTGAVSDLKPTKVKSVTSKSGVKKVAGKADKPWTRWTVTFEDGRSGTTFSKGDADHAENAQKTNALVVPKIEQNGDYFNLAGFVPLEKFQKDQEEQKAEQQHQDEPVTGPENVLVIRKVTTDAGDRFVIQTNKRELVTDQATHADDAVAAREAKKGIIPVFQVIHNDKGRPINRLISFRREDEPEPPANEQQQTEPGDAGEPQQEEQQQTGGKGTRSRKRTAAAK